MILDYYKGDDVGIKDHLYGVVGNKRHGERLLNLVLLEKPYCHKASVGVENKAEDEIIHEYRIDYTLRSVFVTLPDGSGLYAKSLQSSS